VINVKVNGGETLDLNEPSPLACPDKRSLESSESFASKEPSVLQNVSLIHLHPSRISLNP